MDFDRIEHMTPDDLAAAIYRLLSGEIDDPEEFARLRDRRFLPSLNAILRAQGHPPGASGSDLPASQTRRALTNAAFLLGEIAEPGDQESVDLLMGLLATGEDLLKLAAASALGKIGAQQAALAVSALAERMMASGDLGAVLRLSPVLAKIGGGEARARLAAFVDRHRGSADQHVQHVLAQAESAIRSIDERLA